jgi:hypothetical protein
MGWNYRILAHEHNGEIYLQIHEVYYNENNVPDSYTQNAVSIGGEDLKAITWTLNKMLKCRTEPILWAGERFPNECKIKYTCDLCGRDTFDKPSPHKCSGGFRKRGLRWSLNYR